VSICSRWAWSGLAKGQFSAKLCRTEINPVNEALCTARLVRFGTFEVDLRARELRKSGTKLRLSGQPFEVLTILLKRPGEVVTREELQKHLWPDTFVDVEHNLNTAINKIRGTGRFCRKPRFVETLPRRGCRFIGSLEYSGDRDTPASEEGRPSLSSLSRHPPRYWAAGILIVAAPIPRWRFSG
jgi:DNA-binding winged helix-turn-helix (wHTH) protein